MIAYNQTYLRNAAIQEQAENAYAGEVFSKDEHSAILSKYPAPFYTPNFFIRIGLFLLTLVIACFSFGLFALLFISSSEQALGGTVIFFALVIYIALEFMVQQKKHYQSGVDDALLWLSAAMLFGGISFLSNAGALANCVLAFVISFYAMQRFADRLMCIVAYLSLLGIVFFTFNQLGGMVKAMLPFILMATSAVIFAGINYLKKQSTLTNYYSCFSIIRIAALLSFYAAGNFYVVKELSTLMYNLPAGNITSMPFGWLFWTFTFTIPVAYIAKGIQKKDTIFVRTGMLLMAALVFTVRHYYAIASTEIIMTIGGIILLIISYAVTQYLAVPKFGFTHADTGTKHAEGKLQIESLVIAETFNEPAAAETTQFGGGSFSGAGASSDF